VDRPATFTGFWRAQNAARLRPRRLRILDTPRSKIQPTHLVDTTLTFFPEGKKWSIGFWAKNLLDSRYLSTVYDSPGYGGIAGYAPPRQFGGSATFNF